MLPLVPQLCLPLHLLSLLLSLILSLLLDL